MPATLFGEAATSRSLSGGIIDLVYFFNGTDDDDDVLDAVLSTSPTTHNGLERKTNDITIDPMTVSDGSGWWTARVPYGVAEWGFQTGSDSYTFDTSGGTFHTAHSREIVHSYAASGDPPDIGSTGGGPIGQHAEGVGVFIPKLEWEETHIFSWGDIDNSYKQMLRRMTARTNDSAWRDCAAGEAIFLGARGGRLPDGTAAITFRFASDDNKVAADNYFVDDIGPIEFEAWDYVDVHFEDPVLGEDENTALMKKARFVYVHRLYFKGDFTDLGIGS
jgi:hypothetical protein